MRNILWTEQSRSDLAAIHAFLAQDSPHYASVVVRKLIAATEQLAAFPESGRTVPEFDNPAVREIVRRPYRVVAYRMFYHGGGFMRLARSNDGWFVLRTSDWLE